MKYREGLILILILAAVFVTLVIIYNENSSSDFCLTGSACKIVETSKYSQIFGIKVSTYGLASLAVLLVAFFLVKKEKLDKKYFLIISYIGAAFAIYFLSIQFFVLKTVCSNCFIVDSTIILIAILSTYDYLKSKN